MLKAMMIAFSTYSRIPMPQIGWEKENMRYTLCFFPLVGAVTGLCSVLAFWLLRRLGAGSGTICAVLTALPILINGGIHMDGFMDTMDAKRSYKSREEKLRILKDPHAGAFAILSCGLYLLVSFGLFGEITEKEIGYVAAGYILSRTLSGLSVVTLRKARTDGMAAGTADAAWPGVKWVLAVWLAAAGGILLYLDPIRGGAVLLAGALCFWHYRRMAYRTFGGITGDLAGYFLQVCELAVLCALAAVSLAVKGS